MRPRIALELVDRLGVVRARPDMRAARSVARRTCAPRATRAPASRAVGAGLLASDAARAGGAASAPARRRALERDRRALSVPRAARQASAARRPSRRRAAVGEVSEALARQPAGVSPAERDRRDGVVRRGTRRAPTSRTCSTAPSCRPRACWPTRCAARRWRRWGRWSAIPVAPDSPAAFRHRRRPPSAAPPTIARCPRPGRAALARGAAAGAARAGRCCCCWRAARAGWPGCRSALAPPAAAMLPAALLGEPVGLPSLSFFAGALAAGAAIAARRSAGAEARREGGRRGRRVALVASLRCGLRARRPGSWARRSTAGRRSRPGARS